MNTKAISISIFKLVMPLFVLLFIQFAANAQNFDLNGTWTGYFGDGTTAPKPGTITQSGTTLTIDNGEGSKSRGNLSGSKVTASDWGMTGTLSENGTKISWSNNTTWKKNEIGRAHV